MRVEVDAGAQGQRGKGPPERPPGCQPAEGLHIARTPVPPREKARGTSGVRKTGRR